MNSKTRLIFNLAYIHNYINDILDMCNELDNNYPVIFTDKKSQYAINIIALMLCTVKGYWIDKYNDGKDITEDMLPDNIEHKDIIDVLFNRFIHKK